MNKKPRHRAKIRRYYPLSMTIYSWKNRWYYFTKPALKLKALRLVNKLLALVTRWP